MLHIANLLYHAHHADQFGIHILDAKVEWNSVMDWVHQVIDRMRGGTPAEAAKDLAQKGIDVIVGEAAFVSPHELTIAGKAVSAERIIIATGCQNIVPSIEGLNEVGFISNVEAVSLPTLPRSLAVVGGGAIGIEFAQMFRRFGVDVTVLENSSSILDNEQGKLAANNAFAHEPLPFDDQVIPWVTFTDPSLAHVGKTEEQLRDEQVAYQVTRMYFNDVERAISEGATAGLVKLLVDKQGLLLGGHVLAPNAGDLLAPIILAMRAGLTAETLASTIMPYPTMVEGVRWAADKL